MKLHLAHIPYYERTPADAEYFENELRPRLPDSIFDVHVHINLPEHVRGVGAERLRTDWAMECGYIFTCDDSERTAADMFPGIRYSRAGFPWPILEADIHANNRYLAQMRAEGRLSPFMAVRPEWNEEKIEADLVAGGFVGFKPYPDMVSGVKGAEISIFDFLPRAQWALLDKHSKAVVLHLPRKARLADRDNVRELLDARQSYPNVTIIIAHLGRSFCPDFMRGGLNELGGHAKEFHYDLSGVMRADVLRIAFQGIPRDRLMYGSDMPIFLWHGETACTENGYAHMSREPFSWRTSRLSPEKESHQPFFLYAQLASIFDAARQSDFTPAEKSGIFGQNAKRALGING